MSKEESFCGCCGRQIKADLWFEAYLWCKECIEHLLPREGRCVNGPWDRTYHAQYGKDCPYSEDS